MLFLNNITKQFGDKTAVSELSLKVRSGEIYAFVGPNGAGKTTTIKMISGLLHPTSGSVEVCEHDVKTSGVLAREKLAYIPDEPHLYDKLTGYEFLLFVGGMYRMEEGLVKEKIETLSLQFDFSEYMHTLAEEYSHGMKQRIVIAAALLHEPEVLLVDEPMVGLDPRSVVRVKDALRNHAANGGAVFVTSHSLSLCEEIADRIGIMNFGTLIAEGTIDELRKNKDNNLEEIFLSLTEE